MRTDISRFPVGPSDGWPRRGAPQVSGQTSAMRTVGVEEELLLVDVHTGKPRSVASQVIAATDGDSVHGAGEGGVEAELQRYMVETQSSAASELADVEEALRKWRRVVASAAREAGAGVAAIATAPVAGAGLISPAPRYQRMAERFGPTAQEVLTCGCHVHVSVESDEEGIAAIDRIRVWLPVILAMSANSPFYDGRDTGYASYRSQLWMRWPSAGPTDTFGTPRRVPRTGALDGRVRRAPRRWDDLFRRTPVAALSHGRDPSRRRVRRSRRHPRRCGAVPSARRDGRGRGGAR